MSAEIIDLSTWRRSARLRAEVTALHDELQRAPLPRVEDALGWRVVERDEAGRPTRVFCPKYRAFAGYVPGSPELVYLDYRHVTRVYALPLEELVLGLETGFLPDPVAEASDITPGSTTSRSPHRRPRPTPRRRYRSLDRT